MPATDLTALEPAPPHDLGRAPELIDCREPGLPGHGTPALACRVGWTVRGAIRGIYEISVPKRGETSARVLDGLFVYDGGAFHPLLGWLDRVGGAA